MISAISYENMHHFGAGFISQFRLRYKGFIERQQYDVCTYRGMEYDQYDTPAAVYLVYQDQASGEALGVSRLTPTLQGCMLEDLWPHMVEDKSLLRAPDVWEGSRFCIDKNLAPELRRQICYELSAAYIEYGLRHGIRKIIGLMPTLVLKTVFERSGIVLERLGATFEIDGHKVQAAGIPVSFEQLQNVRRKTGISFNILYPESNPYERAA